MLQTGEAQMLDAVIVGEAIIDIVETEGPPSTASPGGSPANVALVLGRLGRTVSLCTALGADQYGETIEAWLAKSGVHVEATRLPKTSTARASVDSSGAAEYEFEINWVLEVMTVPPARIVHSGSIGAWLAPGADKVERLLRHAYQKSTISFDPNIRASLISDPQETRDRIKRLASLADVVKLSDEDLSWIYPDQTMTSVAEECVAAGAALVVVTLGEGGAVAFTKGYELSIPVAPAAVIDTIGAGDTFMGTLLSSLTELDLVGANRREALREISAFDMCQVLQRSAAAAAITVSRPGANPPWASELEGSTSDRWPLPEELSLRWKR